MEKTTWKLLGEEDFEKTMQDVVVPYIKQYQTDGYYDGYDGSKLYYTAYVLPDAKAQIVLFHGYCEFAEKYEEVVYYFLKNGYSVWIPEQRGHGHSERAVEQNDKVHVESFDEYVQDMELFMTGVVPADLKKYLFAHSMGGAIAICYIQSHPDVFDKVVLSSPMCKMKTGTLPFWFAYLITAYCCKTKKGKEFALGQHGFLNAPKVEGSSCKSEARYLYGYQKRQEHEEYRTSGGTYAWVHAGLKVSRTIKNKKRLRKITCPVLMFQAGDDHMVENSAQNYVLNHLPTANMIAFQAARHEIFHADTIIRRQYYQELFRFLG